MSEIEEVFEDFLQKKKIDEQKMMELKKARGESSKPIADEGISLEAAKLWDGIMKGKSKGKKGAAGEKGDGAAKRPKSESSDPKSSNNRVESRGTSRDDKEHEKALKLKEMSRNYNEYMQNPEKLEALQRSLAKQNTSSMKPEIKKDAARPVKKSEGSQSLSATKNSSNHQTSVSSQRKSLEPSKSNTSRVESRGPSKEPIKPIKTVPKEEIQKVKPNPSQGSAIKDSSKQELAKALDKMIPSSIAKKEGGMIITTTKTIPKKPNPPPPEPKKAPSAPKKPEPAVLGMKAKPPETKPSIQSSSGKAQKSKSDTQAAKKPEEAKKPAEKKSTQPPQNLVFCFKCGIDHPKDHHIVTGPQRSLKPKPPGSAGPPMQRPFQPPVTSLSNQRKFKKPLKDLDDYDYDDGFIVKNDDEPEESFLELEKEVKRLSKRKHLNFHDDYDSEAMEAGIHEIDQEEEISSYYGRVDDEREEALLQRQREKAKRRKRLIVADDNE
eukprot:TRINITY_DN1957_c0_g2_i2.p1 TRINITY_DN1957_c0_g2~~TRINITY_DN1957_c0_g2_i2.p1  ORF type:complete len:494 (-),score=131.40 TRINITY_DN1957_c0_g2_i2:77-1558(-)